MKNLCLIFVMLAINWSMTQGQDLISNTRSGKSYPATSMQPKAIAQLIQDRQALAIKPDPLRLLSPIKDLKSNKLNTWVQDPIYFELDQENLQEALENAAEDIQFLIPLGERSVSLWLTRIDVVSDNFQVQTSSGKTRLSGPTGLFYAGIVQSDPHSMVTLSLFQGKLRLLIVDRSSTYILGELRDGSRQYVLYNEKKLMKAELPWECATKDTPLPPSSPAKRSGSQRKLVGGGCVKVYVETEFEVYEDLDEDLLEVTNYALGIFAESIVAYRNVEVNMEVVELFVWDTEDPYSDQEESPDVLDDFISNRGAFNGDLAHLITTRRIGGGIADGIGSICGPAGGPGPHCVSGSLGVTFNISTLPRTSSTFVRVAHEMGHLLGARHTHACAWGPSNDQQIDDCGNTWVLGNGTDDDGDCPGDTNGDDCECCAGDDNVDEADEAEAAEGGDCFDPMNPVAPSTTNGRGTIMSYCHLQTNGRDIRNGFHPEVADVINDSFLTASCLTDEDCACEEFTNRTISGNPIPNGVYSARNRVTSAGDADGTSPQVVVFQAGNQIVLEAGFEAEELFIAQIVDTLCDDPASLSVLPTNLRVHPEETPQDLKLLSGPYALKAFPNPSNSITWLTYELSQESSVEIALYNLNGQKLKTITERILMVAGKHQIEMDLSDLPPGIYICRGNINGWSKSIKIVVQ